MSEAELDYRYGWRWLLPMSSLRSVQLLGFGREDQRFWSRVIPSSDTSVKGARADLLLVDASAETADTGLDRDGVDSARVACVLSGGAAALRWRSVLRQSFPRVREYALLPAANPRVVVPLASPQHAVQGLGLHRPGRRRARAAIWLARQLARVGNFSLLRQRVLLVSTRDPEAATDGASAAGVTSSLSSRVTDYALYLGTPDDNRKTVVLPLGPGVSDILLKVGSTEKAKAALRNEAAALRLLGDSPLAECVPKLQGLTEGHDTLTLMQEYRERQPVSRKKMEQAAVAFLVGLAAVGRGRRPLADWLRSLPATVQETCPGLRQRLRSLAEAGAHLWVHRGHGDFAPWNCAWTSRGLFVFDWEESRAGELALSDAFYFAAAPALHVGRGASVKGVLAEIWRVAKPVGAAMGLSAQDVDVYLAVWLLCRAERSALYRELLALLERKRR